MTHKAKWARRYSKTDARAIEIAAQQESQCNV